MCTLSKVDNLDGVMEKFDRRFRLKKTINLVISMVIVMIGIVPMYIVFAKKAGIYALRWLTVDGTLFTMIGSLIFIVVNMYEIDTVNAVKIIRTGGSSINLINKSNMYYFK